MQNGSSIAAHITSTVDSDGTILRFTSRLKNRLPMQRWSFELVGTFLYQQLLQDAEALQVGKLVCIEFATMAAFRAFLERREFRQVGAGVYNGFTIVRYEKLLLGAGQE
jgi:hypothetical protein